MPEALVFQPEPYHFLKRSGAHASVIENALTVFVLSSLLEQLEEGGTG